MRINNNSLSLSYIFIIITLFTLQTQAWLPGEQREIYSQDGSNLFNTTGFTNTTTPSNYTSTSKIARKRWLPASGTIRGVDLGSLFVLEPWMASTEWSDMGCSGQNSEFDCVSALGQDQANINFQNHWNTWITQDDIDQMQSYGLNTIRVPVGYWMKEDLVYQNSEFFPQGGMGYLERLCGWASDAGFYIIIDLHGAPGAQNADTGQVSS
jgi:aryl-phospho-beta-D-glucosidase BglC (GH1 family)